MKLWKASIWPRPWQDRLNAHCNFTTENSQSPVRPKSETPSCIWALEWHSFVPLKSYSAYKMTTSIRREGRLPNNFQWPVVPRPVHWRRTLRRWASRNKNWTHSDTFCLKPHSLHREKVKDQVCRSHRPPNIFQHSTAIAQANIDPFKAWECKSRNHAYAHDSHKNRAKQEERQVVCTCVWDKKTAKQEERKFVCTHVWD